MFFTLVDVVLILIIFGFISAGFFLGLIRSIGALIGLVIATFISGRYFMPLAVWLTPILRGNQPLARVIAFTIIFILINRIVSFIFKWINTIFNFISFVPFFKTINKFGGAILGLFEGILTLGVFIYVIAKFMPEAGLIISGLSGSKIAHYLVFISSLLIKVLPEAFEKIQTIF
jgi:uncharacterized membrane protein required for colicin V production